MSTVSDCTMGGGLLEVVVFSSVRDSPHQKKRYDPKVQAPALYVTSRLVKGLSHTVAGCPSF
jgi:hypothetical protein